MAYYDDHYGPTVMARRPSFGGGVPFPTTYDSPYTDSFHDERYPPFVPSRRNSMRSVHSPYEGDEWHPVEEPFVRTRSMSNAGYFPPAAPGGMIVAPPMASHPSNYSTKSLRRTASFGAYGGDPYARRIKFRVRNSWRAGISLAEALGGVRLSDSHQYTFHDLSVDGAGRMLLRVRWSGYRSLTYEIPVDGYDGIVHMQSLARRIARSIEHFLTSNYIHIAFDRVILHRLEETSYGTWVPVLTTS